MSIRNGVVISILFLLSGYPAIAAKSPSALIQEAGRAIGSCLQDRDNVKIAVTGIRTLDGTANGLTMWLADSLTSGLAQNKDLHVLERGRLQEIVKENRLSFNDLFDQDKAVKVGRFLNANVIINGTLTKMGKYFNLNLRAVECEKGEIVPGSPFKGQMKGSKALLDLWKRKGGLTLSVFPPNAPASIYIDGNPAGATSPGQNVLSFGNVQAAKHRIKVTAPGSGYEPYEQTIEIAPLQLLSLSIRLIKPFKVTFWQEDAHSGEIIGKGGTIYTGRFYRFGFKANRNCYIYVFNHGTSGKIFPLIPNAKLTQTNYILAGEEKKIPTVGGFPIKGETGIEKIFVIGSMKKLENLDEIARGLLTDAVGRGAGFQREVQIVKQKSLTKDYGLPSEPAVSESVSLNPDDGVVMELTYHHK